MGITRAKERLYLLHAFRRTLYGQSEIGVPSRFLRDIPTRLIAGYEDFESRQGKRDVGIRAIHRTTTWAASSAPPVHRVTETEFRAGDRVHHSFFGEGTVIQSQIRGGDEEVTVAFVGRGIKKLLVSLAKLERVDGE